MLLALVAGILRSHAVAAEPVGLDSADHGRTGTAAVTSASADLCAGVGHDAGFRGDPLVTAVAVALAESRCDPSARGVNGATSGCPRGSVDRGLWQINGCYNPDVSDACAYDPGCNAQVAYRLSAGGTRWSPWSAYNNGLHLSFIGEARAAVQRLAPLKELFASGSAPDLGSTAGGPLLRPLVGMAGTPSGQGYWLVASDGGIFPFGDAPFHGSTGGVTLNRPIVGMTSLSVGDGYRTVAADGGVFCFGDASFLGRPDPALLRWGRAVGIAHHPTGGGYWVVATR